MYSILGFIIFVLDIWAIANVFRSNVDTGAKVLWIVIILILPVIGLIAWYVAGPKAAT